MEKKELVTKANKLNEARYKLTPLEQKLILTVVSKIEPDDEDFKKYILKTIDFMEFLQTDRKSVYRDLKRVVKGLLTKTLEIFTQERNSTLFCNWFSSAEYFNNKGCMEFCFDPKLKPYLLKLKECFVSYKLQNIVQLKSFYSIRFYELLKQYEKIGFRTFGLEDLRKTLGIEKTEYTEYKNFKARILEPAKKEVSEKTDLIFDYSEIRESRKVVFLKFNIYNRSTKEEKKEKEKELIELMNDPKLNKLIELMPPEYQKNKSILDLLALYIKKQSPHYVARNIKYSTKNSKSNYKAFLAKALDNDWGLELQEEEEAKAKKDKEKQDKIKQQKNKEAEEKAENKLLEDYRKGHETELREEAMNQLDEAMKKELKRNTPIGRMALESKILELAAEKSA